MSFYNYKNRVEISITKKELNQMAKEIQMPVEKLQSLIDQILSSTFDSTIKELGEWIDKNVPLIPKNNYYKNYTPKLFHRIQLSLDTPELGSKEVEDSIFLFKEDMLRAELKMGLKSCNLKDGRFYRIRLGFMIEPGIYTPLNSDKNLPSYHFFERCVEFSCNRTLYHLSENYKTFCPTQDIQTFLENTIEVIYKKN